MLTIMMSQDKEVLKRNGGYCSTAEACKELILMKDGVTMVLNGAELAQLYNFVRPIGTAPRMRIPGED